MSAAFNPMLAFNLNSSLVPSVIEEGVLHVHSRPEPGKDIFAGLGGLASLVTGPADRDMLHVYLGETGRERTGKSRAASLQRLLLALEQAKLFGEKRKAYESGRMKALDFPETDLVVIGRVLQGETGLAIHVDRATEILAVMEALDPFELRVALYGAREAWKVADEIARRNIPVVLNVLDNRPVSFDRLGSRLDQANLLHEAGIVVAFMSEYVYQESRMLTQSAGVAVAHGLPWQTALDAITVNPARIFGVSDRLGSLEPGREATLVIWSGDPLELTSYPTHIMVDGEFIEPANRQKLLRDRYRTLVDEDDRPYVYR
jgi:imidazolonepropionase-like amidohydrolase